MEGYIEQNLRVYEATAQEFQDKKELRHEGTVTLVDTFLDALNSDTPSVLELGPGSGYASMLMTDAGANVTALEFSPRMAELAQATAPSAQIINAEFLSHDFKDATYDGILGVAFIHLFPEDDAKKAVAKIAGLLTPKGTAMLSTTKHDVVAEGYMEKTNFQSNAQRFRRQYTQESLATLIGSLGLTCTQYTEIPDSEVSGKTWMNVYFTK